MNLPRLTSSLRWLSECLLGLQAEIQRLDWSEINLTRNLIEVKAEKSKTSQRRLVAIEPNLALWLAPYAERTAGTIMPRNFRVRIEEAWAATKLEKKWPTNGLRHSYARSHLAHHNDAARLALQLGHGTTKMLFAHYTEVVQPSEAKEFWGIVPSNTPANVVPMLQLSCHVRHVRRVRLPALPAPPS